MNGEHTRLGNDRGRLQKDSKLAKSRIDSNGELRIKPVHLTGVAMLFLDAALPEVDTATHVPFANCTMIAGFRVRPPHNTNHELARREASARGGLDNLAERLVSKNEMFVVRGRLSVSAFHDF